MEKLKLGIFTAGNIASQMAATVAKMDTVELVAVAARDEGRARDFAEKYGARRAYGSYEALAEDPEVELVYIATPHSHHYEQTMLCLEHGKHVLCEKAFAANADQAKAMCARAKEKGLFLMEAVWTRFLPLAKTLRELLEGGEIGEVRLVTADLGWPLSHIERMQKPELCGGALLDLGIYPLTFASMVLGGDVADRVGACVKTELGVDERNSMTLIYENGAMAVLHSGMTTALDCRGVITGTKGYIAVDEINCWTGLTQYDTAHHVVRRIPAPEQISGYEFEVEECLRCIRAGELESPVMTHAESIRLMELMDAFRKDWGIRFPFEEV